MEREHGTQTPDAAVSGVGRGVDSAQQRPAGTAKCEVRVSGATGLMCVLCSVWKRGFLCVPIPRDESPLRPAAFLPPLAAGASLGRDLLVADIAVIYLAHVRKPLSQPPVLVKWNCLLEGSCLLACGWQWKGP